jgi:hypothetical protein
MTLVQTSLGILQSGGRVQLSPGDILRVRVSFQYTVAEDTIVTLRACPYQYKLGILDRIQGSCGEADITLERSTTSKLKEATVDMPVVSAANGGISDGTYGLIVEILGSDARANIDDCLVISGNPAGVTDMLPMLMMVMMMSMIMPMMGEM